jgi:hypothetical protein
MKRLFALMAAICAFSTLTLFAQGPLSPEEQEKQLYEAIDKEIERQTTVLDLADWQVFMIDSTLTHDYKAMTAEIDALRQSKVSNSTAYTVVQDKWLEAIYQSYCRILNDEQRARYLKNGAAKAKKMREKRAEKALAAEQKKK